MTVTIALVNASGDICQTIVCPEDHVDQQVKAGQTAVQVPQGQIVSSQTHRYDHATQTFVLK